MHFLILTCRCRDTRHSSLRHAALQHAHSRRGDELAPNAGWPSRELAGDQPKNWRGPSQVLASTDPTNGKPPYPLNPVFADKPSQSRPFVLVFFFLVARVFGYVDALEAVMTAAQKEPFLTDAGDQPSSSSLARKVCVQSRQSSIIRRVWCSRLPSAVLRGFEGSQRNVCDAFDMLVCPTLDRLRNSGFAERCLRC